MEKSIVKSSNTTNNNGIIISNSKALISSFKKRANFERLIEYIFYRFRWIFVLAIILPASLIFDSYSILRNWFAFKLRYGLKWHNRKVAAIQKQINDWHKSGEKKKLCTARSGHLTMCFRYPKYKNTMIGIRTDKLMDILHLDKEKQTIRVEPMVTMGELIRYLIPMGYTLPIVAELDDLTVGGLINGCGIESSGHKYGLFQHICVSYELVTTNGELIVASKDGNSKHQSLFYGIPWSHGTLGFLVAATIRIIPVKKFVRLSYFPIYKNTQTNITQKIWEECQRDENDFVEGIQFDKESGVVMAGSLTDTMPKNGKLNSIGRWYKPWFFKHVQRILIEKNDNNQTNQIHIEYIPIRDYYHRHRRSIFWEIQDLIPFGNNLIFRVLLGWATPPKISLLKATMPNVVKNIYNRYHMIQDLLIPLDKLDEAVNLLDQEVQIYPLWLCPFNLPSQPGLIRNRTGTNRLYIDIGIYGNSKLNSYNPVETTRRIEKYVRNVQGIQMLYADCYQTCAEFWEMFDSSLYDWLRAKYECKTALPTVYEKVCREARA